MIFSEDLGESEADGGGRRVHLDSLLTLAEPIDLRDTGTVDHSQTVGRYAALAASQLGLGPGHVRRIEIAGRLHDVGDIGLPDSILRKRGELSEEDWEQIRRHAEIGAEILGIPLEARILALADAYEALTADRV